MAPDANHDALRKTLGDQGVEFLFGAYVDMFGVPKSKCVPLAYIDEMAAGEPGGSGDKRWSRHGGQRGTPFSPPLNGEKLPSPASVNDRKNRLSAGTRYDGSPAKL